MSDLSERLEAAGEIESLLERQLSVAAIITEALRNKGIVPIVVGGCAAEFYTLGAFATYDLDLVAPGTRIIGEVLAELGFIKEGRHWFHPKADVSVEVPSATLAGDEQRATHVKINDMTVAIIGVEDLILDRLRAAVYWKSTLDEEVVENILKVQGNEIDWTYLAAEADKEPLVAEALARLREPD